MNEKQLDSEKAKAFGAIETHLVGLRNSLPNLDINSDEPGTKIKILNAGRRVFAETGHAGLSLRKVAVHARISVGNLNYHYKTKQDLVEAVLRYALADYVQNHLQQLKSDQESPMETLLNVVEFYVSNARTTHRFFYQLWGYAGSSDHARDFVADLYRPIGRFVYYLVRSANPDLSDTEIRRAVFQIFSLEEGYKIFIGLSPDGRGPLLTAEQDIRALTERIVKNC